MESDIEKLRRETEAKIRKQIAEKEEKLRKKKEAEKEKKEKPRKKKQPESTTSQTKTKKNDKCIITINKYKKEFSTPLEINLENKGELRELIQKELEKHPLKPDVSLEKFKIFIQSKSPNDPTYGALRRRLIPKKKGDSSRVSYLSPTIEAFNEHYDEIKSKTEKFNIDYLITLIIQVTKDYLISELDKK